MTRTLGIGLALVIAGVLVACSSLIPDQTIANAFGLDGVVVRASADGATVTAPTAGPIASTTVSGAFSFELPSDGFPTMPGFIDVASISDVITIRAAVDLSAPGSVPFAETYAITGVAMDLLVASGGATIVDQRWSANDLALTFSGSATYDDASDRTSGTYEVVAEVPLVTLLVRGAAVDAFVDALSDGGTLDVAGTMTIDLQPALPVGAEVTVTLKSLGGTLTF